MQESSIGEAAGCNLYQARFTSGDRSSRIAQAPPHLSRIHSSSYGSNPLFVCIGLFGNGADFPMQESSVTLSLGGVRDFSMRRTGAGRSHTTSGQLSLR